MAYGGGDYVVNTNTLTVNTANQPWLDPGRYGGYGFPTVQQPTWQHPGTYGMGRAPGAWPPEPPQEPEDPLRRAMQRVLTERLLNTALPLTQQQGDVSGSGLTLEQLREAFRRFTQTGIPPARLPPLAAPQTVRISSPNVAQPLTHGTAVVHNSGARNQQESPPVPELTAKPTQVVESILVGLRAARPVHLWGPPGVGKSEMVAQAAARYYVEVAGGSIDAHGRVHATDGRFVPQREYLVDIRAVLLDPVDLRGLPTVVDGKTVWAPPGFFPEEGPAPVTIFLDELNRAPALVQNACLQLALDRRVGEYWLPDNARIVAAGNRESDGGGVSRLNDALSFRFLHVNVETDFDDWAKWAIPHGVDPMVVSFLRYRPNLLSDYQRNQRSCPNPRSWTFVSQIVQQQPARDLERILVSGTVGEGAAVEFLSFCDLYKNLPSIDDILARPTQAPVPTDVATRYAVSSALATRATPANFDRVLAYLNRLPREFLVFGVRDATVRDPDLTETPAFAGFATANADLL